MAKTPRSILGHRVIAVEPPLPVQGSCRSLPQNIPPEADFPSAHRLRTQDPECVLEVVATKAREPPLPNQTRSERSWHTCRGPISAPCPSVSCVLQHIVTVEAYSLPCKGGVDATSSKHL